MDVHRVTGLGMTNDVSTCGYVVFCKTRCCNECFYQWYIQFIVVPWALLIRQTFNLGHDSLCWFQLDGEAVQIECFKSPEIIKFFNDHYVLVGKPPGSSTEITQSCDAGNCFRGTKKVLSSILNRDIEDNEYMLLLLKNMYKLHVERMRDRTLSKDGCGNSQPQQQMAIKGLLRVKLALQSGVHSKIIKSAFKTCGIYPYSLQKCSQIVLLG